MMVLLSELLYHLPGVSCSHVLFSLPHCLIYIPKLSSFVSNDWLHYPLQLSRWYMSNFILRWKSFRHTPWDLQVYSRLDLLLPGLYVVPELDFGFIVLYHLRLIWLPYPLVQRDFSLLLILFLLLFSAS